MLGPKVWGLLTSSHGPQFGPTPQPRARTNVPAVPTLNKQHRTFGFGKFLFSFPTHFRGWGVFQDSDTFVNKERKKKLGEQGTRGQRSDLSSLRVMPCSLFPAARAQRVPQAAACGI